MGAKSREEGAGEGTRERRQNEEEVRAMDAFIKIKTKIVIVPAQALEETSAETLHRNLRRNLRRNLHRNLRRNLRRNLDGNPPQKPLRKCLILPNIVTRINVQYCYLRLISNLNV